MKIVKAQFTYSELCWILESLDDLIFDNRYTKRAEYSAEIERTRSHVIRLLKKIERSNRKE